MNQHGARGAALAGSPAPATSDGGQANGGLDLLAQETIDAFQTRRGRELATAGGARERCQEISEEFVELCRQVGLPARVVPGFRFGELFGVQVVLAGHFAVLIPSRRDPEHGWAGGMVVDWTARQFDPAAQVPDVVPLDRWRHTWRPLGNEPDDTCW